jgi:UDP-3-O-[3-hydroxymyristoyl] N-acetylglucosamine deacetylase
MGQLCSTAAPGTSPVPGGASLAPVAEKEVVLEGWGVHSGAGSRVVLSRRDPDEPVVLRAGGLEATIRELIVVSTNRATTVALARHDRAPRVGTVEHLFAALAGLGVYQGLAIDADAPELPLLDGGAARWTEAVATLAIAPGLPPTRIARAGVIEVGASRYELSPGPVPEVEVSLEFDDARLAPRAAWAGNSDDFRDRIAPARTFAFSRDLLELARAGLAQSAHPTSVVVVAPDAILCAGTPFLPDEPARHKLLDLIGDLYLHGGPPLGRIRAVRPGHAANARALHQARQVGVIEAR